MVDVDAILRSVFGWKATITGPDECWKWNASVDPSGSGRFRLGGKNYLAPKYAYEAAYGPIPTGERLGRLCGDSSCVNYRHISLRSSREMNEVRFWAQVDKSGDCWEWTGALWGRGYGQFHINKKKRLAHRVSFEWANGEIPDGMQVDHSCWNARCVNPEHLRLATHAENMRNMSGPDARSSTGVRGVTLRDNGRYQARIVNNGRNVQVGHFATLEEAERAVHEVRTKLWGQFAGRSTPAHAAAIAAAHNMTQGGAK